MMLTRSHSAVLCTGASVLLLIISIALPYWHYSVYDHFGLWTVRLNSVPCQSYLEVPAYMQATRTFVIIGLLLLACSGLVGFLKLFVMKENAMFPRIAGVLAIAAVPAYMQATRTFVIIGLLLLACSGLVGFLKLFVMKENAMFPRIAGGLAIAGGISVILGASIFGGKVNKETSLGTLHAGFGLAILSGVTSFAAGGLYLASK